MHIEVETRNVDGKVTSLGSAEPFTLVVDRPTEGRGLGFNGGQLLYLAVAGCISNDLFREARAACIELSSVRVNVSGDFVGEPAVSDEIQYEVEVSGDVPEDRLRALIDQVDDIAEIPNSLRQGTQVRLVGAKVATPPEAICRSPSANRASLHATPFGLRFQHKCSCHSSGLASFFRDRSFRVTL